MAMATFINDRAYMNEWVKAAERFTAADATIAPPPADLVREFGRPTCDACWDTGLCCECYGQYPNYCPNECGDGNCSCQAGRARRAAYAASLKEYGLQ